MNQRNNLLSCIYSKCSLLHVVIIHMVNLIVEISQPLHSLSMNLLPLHVTHSFLCGLSKMPFILKIYIQEYFGWS
jgi:hypothetical protein